MYRLGFGTFHVWAHTACIFLVLVISAVNIYMYFVALSGFLNHNDTNSPFLTYQQGETFNAIIQEMGLGDVLNSTEVTNALARGDNVEALVLALVQAAKEVKNSQTTQTTGSSDELKEAE